MGQKYTINYILKKAYRPCRDSSILGTNSSKASGQSKLKIFNKVLIDKEQINYARACLILADASNRRVSICYKINNLIFM